MYTGKVGTGDKQAVTKCMIDLQFGENSDEEGFLVRQLQRFYVGLQMVIHLMTCTSFKAVLVLASTVIERIGPTYE
jgi:hypothetical protein